MKSNMIFDRVYESGTPGADTITIVEGAGEPEGYVTCPVEISGHSFSEIIGELVHIPLAIEVAVDMCKRPGMERIVVLIDDLSLWQPEWGTLRY